MRKSNLLMILVLLPFWTSLLVRTTAWMVLLQQQGVVNDVLVWLGIIRDDQRLVDDLQPDRHDHRHDAYPAALHDPAALFGDAHDQPSYAARRAFAWGDKLDGLPPHLFPADAAGTGGGGALVFILAVGYYITPALVGGSSGQLISNLIAMHMTQTLNWSMAAALAAMLLGGVLILYWVYDRLVGIDNLETGVIRHGASDLRLDGREKSGTTPILRSARRSFLPDRADRGGDPAVLQRRGLFHLYRQRCCPSIRRATACAGMTAC